MTAYEDDSIQYHQQTVPMDDYRYDESDQERAARLQQEEEEKSKKRAARGVGVAAGLVGLVLGGPLVAVVAGVGAAVVSKTDSQAGSVARGAGDAAATTGEKIREWDKKNHVSENVGKGITNGFRYVSDKLSNKSSSNSGSA
eukprot:CAMPEP_0116846724 /NCGR_PEP_ID=MMETSP0418-20121206/14004_1 /TAXON_ID=1158023 /ORGANISM="Astrosyne radiata, Strain 13vi08-1A" /LENGTH=141 /DNA_ID=CAMNT_0004478023 /DNA_START=102 /DNA_END=527 /DNA_ORIENTATION=-